MTLYAVELTGAALAAIAAQARYIAIDAQAPLNALRWLERVWDAVDSLEQRPRRAGIAEEDAYLDYEVRQLIVGSHLLLFTIDEDRRKVWVIGLRHGTACRARTTYGRTLLRSMTGRGRPLIDHEPAESRNCRARRDVCDSRG